MQDESAFFPGEFLPSSPLTRFFPLPNSNILGEETADFHGLDRLGVDERLQAHGQRVPDGPGLTRIAAAVDNNLDVNEAEHPRELQRVQQLAPIHKPEFKTVIFFYKWGAFNRIVPVEVGDVVLDVHVIDVANHESTRSWFRDFDFGDGTFSQPHVLDKSSSRSIKLGNRELVSFRGDLNCSPIPVWLCKNMIYFFTDFKTIIRNIFFKLSF